jgi:hypothetical protein
MNDFEREYIISMLKKHLDFANAYWAEGKDRAFIVGYLEGTIKTAIESLESGRQEVNKSK